MKTHLNRAAVLMAAILVVTSLLYTQGAITTGVANAAQLSAGPRVAIFDGVTVRFYPVSSGLSVVNGVFTVTLPTTPVAPVRRVGVRLTRNAAGLYTGVPTTARNLEVWLNGIHNWVSTDYTVSATTGEITMLFATAEDDVRASWDE